MSPRLDLTVTVNSARLEVPLTHVESDTHGAQVGLPFPRVRKLRSRSACRPHRHAARAGVPTMPRKLLRIRFRGTTSDHNSICRLSQDVEPSGHGMLVHADDLRFAYSRNLTERLSLDASARASRPRGHGGRPAPIRVPVWRRDGWRCRGSSTRAGRSALAGTYARQEYEISHSNADGRRIGFSLAWRPQQ